MDPIIFLITLFDFMLLLALIAGIIRWQKRHGKITEKKYALILLGYFSFSFISLMIPAFLTSPRVMVITIIITLLILWSVGYLYLRYLYRQFNRPK